MKEVSKYIKQFLTKDFLHKNRKHWQSQIPMFSNGTFQLIEKIINQIKEADKDWIRRNETIKERGIDFEKEELPKGESYDYLIPEIRDILEGRKKVGKQYFFTIGEQKVSLSIVYPFSQEDPVEKVSEKKMNDFLRDCLYRVYIWFYIANKERHSECSQTINVYIYLSELFKLLPEDGVIFDQKHANTAFTTPCSPYTNIHIFREEEWFKVLIHESFHCFGFDFSGEGSLCEISRTRILQLFLVDSEVNLFETYCEMWGEFLNVCFYECLAHKTENNSMIIDKIRKSILYEKIFSCFQCVKVLDFLKMKYPQLYSDTEPIPKSSYKENTNILSYYILKSIYMVFIDDFFEWIVAKNKGSLHFLKTPENIHEYMKIIEDRYKDPLYIKNIHIMETWFHKQKNNHYLENQTMRMTVLE
jgi:hypothetical protein